jgi:glycosyltransferase involved in cell wall biosynthesis
LRQSYEKIDAYIAPSKFAGRVVEHTGIPADRVRVIRNFLPDREIGGSADSLRVADRGHGRFLFAGRLEAVKGVRELLDVYSDSTGELGRLVIAGAGGELEADVVAAAQRSSNIEYLGRLSRSDVRRELERSRAALVPSLWDENYPMSVLEARAARVPVVASDMGGLPEMVDHGVDGYTFRAGDPTGLRAALEALAQDQAQARAMGDAGFERLCRENSEASHYEQLLDAYRYASMNRTTGAGGEA